VHSILSTWRVSSSYNKRPCLDSSWQRSLLHVRATPCSYPAVVFSTYCIMAITLQGLNSAKPPSAHTEACLTRQRNATVDDRRVQYRQLISRAVTQRLHSPSLDDLTKTDVGHTLAHTLKAWETQERCIARDKARNEAEMLGIPWSKTTLPFVCISTLHTGFDM
jgi:hypothetical protein